MACQHATDDNIRYSSTTVHRLGRHQASSVSSTSSHHCQHWARRQFLTPKLARHALARGMSARCKRLNRLRRPGERLTHAPSERVAGARTSRARRAEQPLHARAGERLGRRGSLALKARRLALTRQGASREPRTSAMTPPSASAVAVLRHGLEAVRLDLLLERELVLDEELANVDALVALELEHLRSGRGARVCRGMAGEARGSSQRTIAAAALHDARRSTLASLQSSLQTKSARTFRLTWPIASSSMMLPLQQYSCAHAPTRQGGKARQSVSAKQTARRRRARASATRFSARGPRTFLMTLSTFLRSSAASMPWTVVMHLRPLRCCTRMWMSADCSSSSPAFSKGSALEGARGAPRVSLEASAAHGVARARTSEARAHRIRQPSQGSRGSCDGNFREGDPAGLEGDGALGTERFQDGVAEAAGLFSSP